MKTLQELKAIFDEKDIRDELYELIKSNNLEAVKEFLKDYPVPEVFLERCFKSKYDDEDEELSTFFPPARILAKAGFAYDKYKSFAMMEYFESLGLKADDEFKGNNALSAYIDWKGKNPKVIEYFLSKGATFEIYDKDGWAPLHSWASFNEAKELEVALKAGANIEVKLIKTDTIRHKKIGWQRIGATPLHHAASSERGPACTAVLLKYGAEVNTVHYDLRKDGTWINIYSVLDVAYSSKNKQLVKQAGAKTWKQLVKEYNIDTSLELSEQYRIYNELLEKKKTK